MNRSFVSALFSLACLTTLPALAQAGGSTQPDVTLSVAANPTASGVSLSGMVQPPMPSKPTALPHPGGMLTFFDGGTALNTGGTALTAGVAYSSATFAQTFGTPDAVQATPPSSWQYVIGDFNEDGTPDLLLFDTNMTAGNIPFLQVFASIPGGKFVVLPQQSFPFRNIAFPGLSVLDVDGDGHLDLLIGNLVVRGKGDGTFFNTDATVLPVLGSGFTQAYAVDVNGDGKLDIVAVNTPPKAIDTPSTVQFTFTVFRNDGGGTFTSLGSFPLAPSFQTGVNLCCVLYNIYGLSFADVNGDGRIDVLSQSTTEPDGNFGEPPQLNVMLNLGTGFSAPKAIDTSTLPALEMVSIAFADLNNDGKQDLVFSYQANTGNNGVATLLGNGDGTFAAPVNFTIGSTHSFGTSLLSLVAADVNADGKADVVLGSGVLLLGNGDGTLTLSAPFFAQPPISQAQAPPNYPLLQANLFPHSWPSLIYLGVPSGANAVFTPEDSSSASANVALSAGAHTLTAHYSGDSTYAAAVSPEVSVTVAPAVTTTTVTSSANPSYAGQSITFTATIGGPAPGAGGTVTFSNGSTTLGTATVSNGIAKYATTLSSAVNEILRADF